MPRCGIITFTVQDGEIYFLLKKRRDSISFISLLREASDLSTFELRGKVSSLTTEDIDRIRKHSFGDIWHDFNIYRKNAQDTEKARKNYEVVKEYLKGIRYYIKNKKEPFLWGLPSDKINQISRKKFKEHELNCALRSAEKSYGICQPLKFLEAKPIIVKDTSSRVKYKIKYFLVNMHEKKELDPIVRKSSSGKTFIRKKYMTPYSSELKWVTLKESKHLLSKGDIDVIQKAAIAIDGKLHKGFQYKNVNQLYKVIENYDNKNQKSSPNIINYID